MDSCFEHKAQFWGSLKNNAVHCCLCRFQCCISEDERGRCGVRLNRNGTLCTLVYGRCAAKSADPIEKKPLYHFYPGSRSFSIATVGCNFSCRNCQNHSISQWQYWQDVPGELLSAKSVVQQAVVSGCASIACTYTEPTIYYEYAQDILCEAAAVGLPGIFVSNGYIEEEPLRQISPVLAAANIDLKTISEQTHRMLTGADLKGVLASLRLYKKLNIWLEVTTLVIDGVNDSDSELSRIAAFICQELGSDTPWHISACYPAYQLDVKPTPAATIVRARQLGLDNGLKYVYSGNISDEKGQSTFCPECGRVVLERRGHTLTQKWLNKGCCNDCCTEIPGIGMDGY